MVPWRRSPTQRANIVARPPYYYIRAAGYCAVALLLLGGPGMARASEDSHQASLAKLIKGVSSTRMLADVTRLSSNDFNGRQTGSPDDTRSAGFVSQRLGQLFTRTDMAATRADSSIVSMQEPVTVQHIGDKAVLELFNGQHQIAASVGTDYLPILDSPSVGVTAGVVFVGYGISDPARGFDEYQGIDVRDRIVLFLRGTPRHYQVRVSHAEKERVAREMGAVAFLTATGPVRSAYELRRGIPPGPLAFYGRARGGAELPLPGAWISTDLAESILSAKGHSLRAIQKGLNQKPLPQSLSVGVIASLRWDTRQTTGPLVNVLGLLPGTDPSLKDQTVIIGAHRDHFGRQAGLVFPGADDNATGTAILLEVARALVDSGQRPRRSILFISFSGEEQGLLGSRLYIAQPTRRLKDTVAMINVDHAGIGNGRLTIGVQGLSKDVAREAGRAAGLADTLDLYGYFPGGDHVPFKEAGIPTIAIVSAGPHPHFHQPTDSVETLSSEILERVARYVLALTWHLANHGP